MNNNFYNEPAEVIANDFDTLAYVRMETALTDMGAALDLIATENGHTQLKRFSVTSSSTGYKISVTTTKTRYISRPRC